MIAEADFENEHLNSFEISPNPVINAAEIKFSLKQQTEFSVVIYDFMDRELARPFTGNARANEVVIIPFERRNLSGGVYTCKIATANGQSFENC